MAAAAQTVADTVGFRRGGVGTHFLVGALGGRFDVRGGDGLDVLGARAGVGFGELVQLTGFYWRSVDVSERDFLADRGWGGEAQLNLNAGFGVTPFLTGGLARVRLDTLAEQTAATLGGGFLLPLGPVLLRVAASDYLFGVTGLSGDDGPDGTTHNWLFTAGVAAGLGRGRSREPIVAARPAEPPPVARVDTVVIRHGDTEAEAPAAGTIRSYQSDRRVEVPLPLEGSITIRYGPEPATTPAVAVVGARAAADGVSVPPPPAGSGNVQDPAVQAWLRDLVSAQVAEQLRRQPAGPFTPDQTERMIQRITDTAVARLEAADAQRMNALRADLRQALAAQRELLRAEVARLESRLTGEPRVVERAAPERDPLAPLAPEREPVPAVEVATFPAPEERMERLDFEAERRDAARAAARIRVALSEVASSHPGILTTAEAERGPAAVLSDRAFGSGAVLVDDRARAAIREIAVILREGPDRLVFVEGHTDSVGSELSNLRLSELRAEAVRSLLVQEGVDSGRVYALGYGHARPIASNATAAGRALNRRVEIVVGDPRAVLVRRNGE